jgi:hypothetical protein
MFLAPILLSQIPAPPAGALENWLVAAAGVASMFVLFKKVLGRKPPVESEFVSRAEFRNELNGLRDKIDARFLNLGEKMEAIKDELLAAGERRGNSIHRRLNELESGLARVDERTKPVFHRPNP